MDVLRVETWIRGLSERDRSLEGGAIRISRARCRERSGEREIQPPPQLISRGQKSAAESQVYALAADPGHASLRDGQQLAYGFSDDVACAAVAGGCRVKDIGGESGNCVDRAVAIVEPDVGIDKLAETTFGRFAQLGLRPATVVCA